MARTPLTFGQFNIFDGSSNAWSTNSDSSKDSVHLQEPMEATHVLEVAKGLEVAEATEELEGGRGC